MGRSHDNDKKRGVKFFPRNSMLNERRVSRARIPRHVFASRSHTNRSFLYVLAFVCLVDLPHRGHRFGSFFPHPNISCPRCRVSERNVDVYCGRLCQHNRTLTMRTKFRTVEFGHGDRYRRATERVRAGTEQDGQPNDEAQKEMNTEEVYKHMTSRQYVD